MNTNLLRMSLLAALLAAAVSPAQAQVPPPGNTAETLSSAYTGKAYSPYAGRTTPTQPFWGDTHLHTNISMDAGLG